MDKADGAFLTISELSAELGLPQHILRYWESKFPQLKPLQRSGNRRYYRPRDVELARRINHLLNVEGFKVEGAQKALKEPAAVPPRVEATSPIAADELLSRLEVIRNDLARAIGA